MSNWTSVRDEYPEKNQKVLGWDSVNDALYVGEFVGISNHSITLKTDVLTYNEFDNLINERRYVTHWTHLPEMETIPEQSEAGNILRHTDDETEE